MVSHITSLFDLFRKLIPCIPRLGLWDSKDTGLLYLNNQHRRYNWSSISGSKYRILGEFIYDAICHNENETLWTSAELLYMKKSKILLSNVMLSDSRWRILGDGNYNVSTNDPRLVATRIVYVILPIKINFLSRNSNIFVISWKFSMSFHTPVSNLNFFVTFLF